MKFMRQGRGHAIDQALPKDRSRIKDTLSGKSLTKPRSDLLAALFDGKLELIGNLDRSEAMRDRLAGL